MKKKIKFSANFKRDYVAMSAVVIFFAIVMMEIVLAISIPLYLEREDAMVLQEQRLTMLSTFDYLRNLISGTDPVNSNAELELALISWEVDKLAIYLRKESDHLTKDEIAQVQNLINEITGFVNTLRSRKSFSAENKLDTSLYIKKAWEKVRK